MYKLHIGIKKMSRASGKAQPMMANYLTNPNAKKSVYEKIGRDTYFVDGYIPTIWDFTVWLLL